MSTYDRINELKKSLTINSGDKVSADDLELKDEEGKTFLEYIVEKKIAIYNQNLLKYISSKYDLLMYTINNDYYLDKYYNNPVLFDESRGKSPIELIFSKKPTKLEYMSLDIINRLFENVAGKYMIEKFLTYNHEGTCGNLIKRITNFDTLYSCLSSINRLDLMKYSNENCLLSKTPSGKTMLEELLDNGHKIDTNNKSYRTAKVYFERGEYQSLLKFEPHILVNYPDKENSYLKLLIEKYKAGEKIVFSKSTFFSNDKKSMALAYILLLKNKIAPSININNLVNIYSNNKPLILYMLEIDKELTIRIFNIKEVIDALKQHIIKLTSATEESLKNMDLNNVFNYLPNLARLIEKITKEGKKEIEKRDIYEEDLLKKIDGETTILEYALQNNIKIPYYFTPKTVEEVIVATRIKKNINTTINEKLLYEKTADGRLLIEYLIEDKHYEYIKNSARNDLRILDYCTKYDCFEIINYDILNELFIEHNGYFLAEKYLNNEKFIRALKENSYKLDKDKLLKLYKKGYKSLVIDAKEDILLLKYNNGTILEDLLKSGISPTFEGYDFKSVETIKILRDNNRPDLMYNATLELLMDYPDKENNYLQYMIDCHKKGMNVNFEKKNYFNINSKDTQMIARCYIQMARNGLVEYLNTLEEHYLVSDDANKKSLLYYLITLDRDITLKEILKFNLQKSPKVFAELKLLGVDAGLLDVSYERYACADRCRETYAAEYDEGKKAPVEVEALLNQLRELFYNDGKSDKSIVDALVTAYRYSTSVNPIFIDELTALIAVKKKIPNFYYIKEKDTGHFKPSNGVTVDDTTISTLLHETGHALHYYYTEFETPNGYAEQLLKINEDPEWLNRVDAYAKAFQELKKRVHTKAESIVEKHVVSDGDTGDEQIKSLLSSEKEQIIQQYLQKGYTRETLDVVLNGSFTLDEFIKQKREIEIHEIMDAIFRYDYDGFTAIGDFIDAISSGKFKSGVLRNKQNELIPVCYGHGIRYYSKYAEEDSLQTKFNEMIANYMAIIKSKHATRTLNILRLIVGDELVDMLDEFYQTRILGLSLEKKNSNGLDKR